MLSRSGTWIPAPDAHPRSRSVGPAGPPRANHASLSLVCLVRKTRGKGTPPRPPRPWRRHEGYQVVTTCDAAAVLVVTAVIAVLARARGRCSRLTTRTAQARGPTFTDTRPRTAAAPRLVERGNPAWSERSCWGSLGNGPSAGLRRTRRLGNVSAGGAVATGGPRLDRGPAERTLGERGEGGRGAGRRAGHSGPQVPF